MNLMDPTHPRAAQMRAILAGLGAQQTPQITDAPVMGQANPMASPVNNPAAFMGPGNPMQSNPFMMLPKVFGK